MRSRLPNRRQAVTQSVQIGNRAYQLRAGLTTSGEIRELWICGHKTGSDLDALSDVLSILISRCLQHGDSIAELRHAVGEQTVAGPALDWLLQLEREVAT